MSGRRQAADRRSLAAKTVLTLAMRDSVLAQAARDVAVKEIRASLGTHRPSLRKIYQVIAEARAIDDPASVKPRAPRRPKTLAEVQEPAPAPRRHLPTGEPLDGWWFGATTVIVTRLGFGSMDCLRIPVSVSCVPRPVASTAPNNEATVACPVYRSLGEAMAAHALAPLSDAPGENPQTEPARPHQRQ